MSISPAAARRPVLCAGQYALLATGFFVVALYGCLVPFHYQPLPLAEALAQFRAIPYLPLGIQSRSDWVANILLFIPLSYLLMAAACVDRPRVVGLAVACIVIPFCWALSLAIEFVQVYFPPRTMSLNDVEAESIGAVIGTLVWLVGGQRSTGWLRRLWTSIETQGLAAQLLPGYLIVLVLIHVMPLDLTISPVEVYHKYKEGRIHLVPFTPYFPSGYDAVQKVLFNALYFLPAGVLLACLPAPVWQNRRSWMRVLALGLALAGGIEFLQLFVWTRYCDTTDVFTGGLAVLLGWWAGLAYRAWRARARAGIPRMAWLALWLGVVLSFNWRPFDFVADLSFAAARLQAVSLIPFADYYQGTDYNAFDQFLHKSLLFLPLGVLLTPARHRPARGMGIPVFLTAAAVAALVEAGQLFLPGRYASVTDVLIASLAAWLGFAITCRFRFGLQAQLKSPR